MMKTKLSIIFSLFFIYTSCSDSTYSEMELYQMGVKVEPDIKIILPKTINDGVKCYNYGPGCLGGKKAVVRKVEIILVEFETEEFARMTAMAINQYYARNWVFDDVTGEPVLEHFVTKVFNAKKPLKK